ncbi:helix-turn-helix domain-containing protein [Alicyclobacillus sp. ALC3]|uniref:helix-turn-helix domain-containing protein n=1 Tax=Alicyclobacillus sp. ALC3 TaxID=2796143 RepID=UPI00237814B2|nr:helix-turn-helix domain-containing protein [Alicyclobacillus sp. ALC3]WDL96901.1 helix-turn-helix domain-containing protein [Alicyclobacillus sp. ALC3]
MSSFDEALQEMQSEIATELEERLWARIEPRIQQALLARYMTVTECAQYLHTSDASVRRLIADRTIPHFRVRERIIIRQHDVDRWVERQITEGGR